MKKNQSGRLHIARIPTDDRKTALWLIFGPLTGLLVVNTVSTILTVTRMIEAKPSYNPEINPLSIYLGLIGLGLLIATLICIPLGINLMNKKIPGDSLEFDTRSGMGKYSQVPQELKKWNWGAFGLNAVWGAYFRVWISFFSFIPLVGIIFMILLGMKGNEWAWRKNAWLNIEEFKAAQEKWRFWGIIFFILNIIATIATLFVEFSLLS